MQLYYVQFFVVHLYVVQFFVVQQFPKSIKVKVARWQDQFGVMRERVAKRDEWESGYFLQTRDLLLDLSLPKDFDSLLPKWLIFPRDFSSLLPKGFDSLLPRDLSLTKIKDSAAWCLNQISKQFYLDIYGDIHITIHIIECWFFSVNQCTKISSSDFLTWNNKTGLTLLWTLFWFEIVKKKTKKRI